MKAHEFSGHGEARYITGACMKDYNTNRPHNAQKGLSPPQFDTQNAHTDLRIMVLKFKLTNPNSTASDQGCSSNT